jgi:hypothetical protein
VPFDDLLDEREGEKKMILDFFDQEDALDKALVIVRDVLSLFPGTRNKAFPDIEMDRLFRGVGEF